MRRVNRSVRRPVVLVEVRCPVHGQKRRAKPPWHVLLGMVPCVVDENLLAMPQLCADCGREVELRLEPVAKGIAVASR
jgi:hypothetical protein